MNAGNDQAHVVCVTGMHRSGTSLATRALQLVGASLGAPDLLLHPGRDNPTGYWENRLIKELDDEILAELGGSWDHPPVLQPGWQNDPALDPWRLHAIEILDSTFGPEQERSGVLAWKDPRASLLLPFWQTVTTVVATVLVVRHPVEVARSLARRNAMPATAAAALWLRYVLAALELRPEPLLIGSHQLYDRGSRDSTLRTLARHAGLPEPGERLCRQVADELDPTLRHHVAEHETEHPRDPITALAELVWNGGDLQPDALDAPVRTALSQGWLRAPADTAALDEARAKVVKLQETLRRRAREQQAAKARREAKAAARRAERDRRTTDGRRPPPKGKR